MRQPYNERIKRANQAVKVGLGLSHSESLLLPKGRFILHMEDARTGEVLEHWEKDNIITKDAGILAARLFRNNSEPLHGLNMLAVGTGATGAILSPDAPSNDQRSLNNEIARKAFSSTTFRTSSGVAVSYPTNIVDFTTTFGEAEAVGPLNEMGLLSTKHNSQTNKNTNNPPASYDSTIDTSLYDTLVNYLTFSVVTKPSTAILTLTWRLSF